MLLLEALMCPNCSAPYRKKIPQWATCVKCENCGTQFIIHRKETGGVSRVVRLEVVSEHPKSFCLVEFSEFMKKRGYTVDPVSGGFKIGPVIIYVSEDGVAEGSEPHRTKVERWILEYMKT
jgi:hypothetical protein